MPLVELWDASGQLTLTRQQDVGKEVIAELLRRGRVQFVVANVGEALRWITPDDRFRFWKEEVQPHLAEPGDGRRHLEDFPGEYCYRASAWGDIALGSVVVLEKYH